MEKKKFRFGYWNIVLLGFSGKILIRIRFNEEVLNIKYFLYYKKLCLKFDR